jgi:SAM-dependent methyltransferase
MNLFWRRREAPPAADAGTAAAAMATPEQPPPPAAAAAPASIPTPTLEHGYGDAPYWEARYAAEPTPFDWYVEYERLAPLLHRYVRRDAAVLHVGAGLSRLQEGMATAGGYADVLNVDISEVAVAAMAARHAALAPALSYAVADVRAMPELADASFDAVVDKGTLDALVCGTSAARDAARALQECCRCVLCCSWAVCCAVFGVKLRCMRVRIC